jgi:hypothetical protein
MSSNPKNLVVSPFTPRTKFVDENGYATWEGLKFLQGLAQAVNGALDILGQFNGIIGPSATISGRPGTVAAITQHLTAAGQLAATQLTGLIASTQLPAADPITQGAVVLPAGAPSNVLDSAAFQPATAFDTAGAAATAQTNAQTFASAGDVTTLAAAKSYTDGKFPGVAAHTITLLKLTGGGTDGSITWNANGVVTGFVDPT